MAWWARMPREIRTGADARAASLTVSGRAVDAVLNDIDGDGALVATSARPPLSSQVSLSHPQAGTIGAEVIGVERAGLRLRFDRSERAVGFALAVVAAGAAARD